MNSSYPTKAEFNNCFIIHSKYCQILEGENELYSFIKFKTLKYFSKDETGRKGLSFAIIFPPSSA